MGKNFSNTKTDFEVQKEKMSEELMKAHNSITNGISSIKDDINIYNLALEVLNKFKDNLITLKVYTKICSEKNIMAYSEPYINISSYFAEYEKEKKNIPRKKEEQFKREYLNKIAPEITKLLKDFLDKLINYLNNCVPEYTFFLTTVRIDNWTVYVDRFFCRFEFGIDFK